MSVKNLTVLAINPGHNGSTALVKDGKLEFYVEEERLTRKKYDANPFFGLLYAVTRYDIDILVIGGTYNTHNVLEWSGEDPYSCFVKKFFPNVKIIKEFNSHHSGHASCAFYNSGFKTASAIVIDGCGSEHNFTTKVGEYALNYEKSKETKIYEGESIYTCGYPNIVQKIYSNYGLNENIMDFKTVLDKEDLKGEAYISKYPTIVKCYEAITDWLGFEYIEAGKTMGLSSYGKFNEKFSNLLIKKQNGIHRGNANYFINNYPAGCNLDCTTLDIKVQNNYESRDLEWQKDPNKVTEEQKDLSWAIQNQSQIALGDLVQKAIDLTGEKNIVIAGGYGLNCVANYYLKKRFPNINLYVEPISHDGGTAIGLAKKHWYKETESHFIEQPNNIYFGPKESANIDLDYLKQQKDFIVKEVTYNDVAKLISEKNIVCLFQGRSEAGPRALGNRSILYDPRDPNGKEFVNLVKRREWFRPFAGSIMEEYAEEYFDMAGLKSSPFMMYAVDVLEEKRNIIPSITHVDNTCRIQTVSEKDNFHYYNLIKSFKDITGVPILFNTSFNLAGDPLVETFTDALETLLRSDMKYLYIPEYNKLLEKVKK